MVLLSTRNGPISPIPRGHTLYEGHKKQQCPATAITANDIRTCMASDPITQENPI